MVVVSGGPSPKRRRTGSGSVSADAIAQANSTVQVFTRQRQNRWMQGHMPPETNGEEEAVASSTRQKQTQPNAGLGISEQQSGHTVPTTRALSADEGGRASETAVGARTGATLPEMPTPGGTMYSNPPLRPSVVEYESPSLSTLPNSVTVSANGGTRKSSDRIARPAAQVGLPSPAPSEENTNSPTVATFGHTGTQPGIREAGSGGPKRQSNAQMKSGHGHGSNRSISLGKGVASPAVMNPRALPAHLQGQPRPSQYAVGAVPPTMPGVQNVMLPSQSHFQTRRVANHPQLGHLSLENIRGRFRAFGSTELQNFRLNNVDTGRYTLLSEAIAKADYFYIILSQLHALTQAPDLLPAQATKLDSRSFAYLDMLLCPNKEITPGFLQWLAIIPVPIKAIDHLPADAKQLYDSELRAVVRFLQLLPVEWDGLVAKSKERQSPPLVEDLYDSLGLRSPVLQTTAFRAISRIILDVNNAGIASDGLEKLEIMHQLDQAAFAQNRRRNASEKQEAYGAYRKVLQLWKEYLKNLHLQMARQAQHAHGPPQARTSLPAFVLPRECAAVFETSATIAPQERMAVTASVSYPMSSQQQYQIIHANGHLLNQMRPTPLNVVSLHPQPVVARTYSISMPSQEHPPSSRLLFPHETEPPRAQPVHPDTAKSALHQAHLRSPIIGLMEVKSNAPRLYRHITGYALVLKRLDKNNPIQTFNFKVADATFNRLPPTTPSRLGEPPSRILDEQSQTLRFRCATIPDGGFPTEGSWVVTDTYWPDNVYFELNGKALEQRKKLHHGRNLPIDVTTLVNSGENSLKVFINRTSTDTSPFSYVIAVEIVGVMGHESLIKQIKPVKKEETLAAIKKSLSGGSEDDDIAITSSNLTIKLFDPYSSCKIFDTPVRGASCQHKDCFDLETFLSMCKREKPSWPTVVDCWRCPLCRGDVRPQTLVRDEYLVAVRKELEKKNLLDTRAIVVEADGSWRPKEEERTGVRSPSIEDERSVPAAASKRHIPAKAVPEVIEID